MKISMFSRHISEYSYVVFKLLQRRDEAFLKSVSRSSSRCQGVASSLILFQYVHKTLLVFF